MAATRPHPGTLTVEQVARQIRAIETVQQHLGTLKTIGELFGVSPATVSRRFCGLNIPPEWARVFEERTGVPAEDLNPQPAPRDDS